MIIRNTTLNNYHSVCYHGQGGGGESAAFLRNTQYEAGIDPRWDLSLLAGGRETENLREPTKSMWH